MFELALFAYSFQINFPNHYVSGKNLGGGHVSQFRDKNKFDKNISKNISNKLSKILDIFFNLTYGSLLNISKILDSFLDIFLDIFSSEIFLSPTLTVYKNLHQ